MSYTLITNFYNEADKIEDCVKSISEQTLQPVAWILINDGSTDDSGKIAKRECRKHDIAHYQLLLPAKPEPDLDSIGKAWNELQPFILNGLAASDYIAVTDFDNRFPPEYFANLISFLDNNQDVGAVAGFYSGRYNQVRRPRRDNPQGGGKVIRRSLVESITKYWDLAPDSFFNIKARAAGLKTLSLDTEFETIKPLQAWSPSGQYRQGRRTSYVRTNPLMALYLAVRSPHSFAFLKGYLKGLRSDWRCDDPDVKYAGSLRFGVRRLFGRVKRVFR